MSSPISRPSTGAGGNKKFVYSTMERELIVSLVRERPVIEDNKGNDSINRELRRQAWEDIAAVFNDNPDVTHRTSIQLKKCWENMKSLRKKEIIQKSGGVVRGLKRSEFLAAASDKIDPYLNFKESDGIDSTPSVNGDVVKVEIEPVPEAEPGEDDSETLSEPPSKRCHSETDVEITRCSVNTQQDLLELKIQRENILLEREKNTLAYEKQFHELQLEKIRLEIELLKKKL